jgi:NADH-quinone oxidoreductase subunit L
MDLLISAILLLPLAGAVLQVLGQRLIPRRGLEGIACAAVVASFLAAAAALALSRGHTYRIELLEWIRVADLRVAMSLLYDPTAAVMALMVTFVSGLIHIYSVAFMRDEQDFLRYFSYLNLFVFSMLVITLADDLLFLFLGWEGVGFCSYALIGFWYRDLDNCLAGNKAFILTRIGDVAFIIAVALLWRHLDTLSLSALTPSAVRMLTGPQATLIGFLLLIAAAGKSAQLPLSVWLPDAMAGPTPVSALIHAATMVTAGVYLLIRVFPLLVLSPAALAATAFIGAVTALYAGCAALAQMDIKRVLAYSTISQVGYMFLGVGAGVPIAAMFHLLGHAFFKALLFLGAGCIIQALDGEHDIYRMGQAVRRRFPALFWIFLAGILSLAAVPPTTGFFSKGAILEAAYANAGNGFLLLWLTALAAAFLTALYSFRLFFLAFLSPGPADRGVAFKPLPPVMTAVIWPLALLAIIGGLINLPLPLIGGDWLARFMESAAGAGETVAAGPATAWTLGLVDGLVSLAGLLAAYLLYGPPDLLGWRQEAPRDALLHQILFAGFGLDNLYRLLFTRPYRAVADFLWRTIDEALVDGTLLAPGRVFYGLGRLLRLWSTGRLTTALQSFFIGFAVLLLAAALKLYGIW